MMILKSCVSLSAAVICVGVLGCGVVEPPSGEAGISITVDLHSMLATDINVTKVHVVAASISYTVEMELTIDGTSASGRFENLPAGVYELTVTLFDGETIVANGSGTATIRPGETSTAVIQIAPSGGDLVVVVEWGADVPVLISPAAGAVLDNGCSQHQDSRIWDFAWTAVDGADAYHLYVRHEGSQYPIEDLSSLTLTSYHSEDSGYIINSNRLNWYWRVRALVEGEWSAWSETRYFNVEPLDTDCGA